MFAIILLWNIVVVIIRMDLNRNNGRLFPKQKNLFVKGWRKGHGLGFSSQIPRVIRQSKAFRSLGHSTNGKRYETWCVSTWTERNTRENRGIRGNNRLKGGLLREEILATFYSLLVSFRTFYSSKEMSLRWKRFLKEFKFNNAYCTFT